MLDLVGFLCELHYDARIHEHYVDSLLKAVYIFSVKLILLKLLALT
jgi:hypothetical protein